MHKIEIKKLNYDIENKTILQDITMNINKNTFTGLIGPNGCGKSTLLKTIYRFYHASPGSIFIGEKSSEQFSSKEFAKKLSVVTQEKEQIFDFKVKDIVLMSRYCHKGFLDRIDNKDLETVYKSLEIMGIRELAERSFLTLSGGEQQRVIIARAIAQQSEVIVLDEPTNHLDIKYQIEIMKVLKKLGNTIITSLHDINTAMAYCDYIYVMKEGTVHSHGITEEVISEHLIYEVFGVKCKIIENPLTGKPQLCF